MNSFQDIFNAAYKAFIVEGKPPASVHGSCRYLTDTGNKCAVGLCIPDGHPAQSAKETFAVVISLFPDLFPDLQEIKKTVVMKIERLEFDRNLNHFQRSLHDTHVNGNNNEWILSREELKVEYLKIAQEYNLTVPE